MCVFVCVPASLQKATVMTGKPALLCLDFCLKIWQGNIRGGNAKTTRTAQAVKK